MEFSFRWRLFTQALKGLINPASAQSAYGLLAGIFSSGGAPSSRGTAELLRAYRQMPWLRAVTNKVARSVASVPWRLYVVKGISGKAVRVPKIQRGDINTRKVLIEKALNSGEIQEIEDHPLLDILGDANPFMVGLAVRQITQIWLDLVGEAFWIKERNNAGAPAEIWPVPPSWVIRTPTPSQPYYEVSFRGWQGRIPETEIVWFSEPSPENPYARGAGIAEALGDELETDEYAAKHTKNWFYNQARPDLLIAAEGLSKPDTERLEEDWLAKNQGFWRAFKPYFLNKKIEVHQLSQSFESMQLVDLRKYERDTIIQVYGVPPELFGIIENSNRATIETADYLFTKWVVVPRLELTRATLQERLVPDFDDRLILDYDSPVSEDKQYQLNASKAAPWALTIDEWRQMQGLEPLPDDAGKVHMVPFNLVPTRGFGGQGTTETGGKAPKLVSQHKALREEDVFALLEACRWEALWDELASHYKEIVKEFGQRAVDIANDRLNINISFDLLDPRVVQFLESDAGKLIKDINGTTLRHLREQLVEGVNEGESIPKLAKRISEVFSEAKGRRSVVIARTEVVRASNFGAYEGMRQGGVPKREWLATRDDRVRDSHLAADGQIVGIDQPFTLGSGVQTMYPGASGVPEEDIQCRCTTAPVFDERSLYDTEEKRAAAWRKYDADIRPYERQFEAATKRGFQAQQNAVMDKLKELGKEGD